MAERDRQQRRRQQLALEAALFGELRAHFHAEVARAAWGVGHHAGRLFALREERADLRSAFAARLASVEDPGPGFLAAGKLRAR